MTLSSLASLGYDDIRTPVPPSTVSQTRQNITLLQLVKVEDETCHFSPELATIAITTDLQIHNPSGVSFRLDVFNEQNVIEQDGSLSRRDVYFVGERGLLL